MKLYYPPKSVVLVGGVPGSGKSTLLEQVVLRPSGVRVISADDVRGVVQERHGLPYDDFSKAHIDEARGDFFNHLAIASGWSRNILCEAAYLSEKSQSEMVQWGQQHGYSVHLLVVGASLEECLVGVLERSRPVPADVVRNYYTDFIYLQARLNARKIPRGLQSATIIDRVERVERITFGA